MRAFGTIAVTLSLLAAVPAAAAGPELKSEEQKTVYAIGLSIAQSLGAFALTPAEIDLVSAGLRDGLANSPKVDLGQYNAQVKQLAQQRSAAVAEIEKKESAGFLERIGKEKGAEQTASGLIYIPVKPGTGPAPKATDTVKVHYKGTLRDGSVFDSSIERGQPATFPLNRVVPCWTEGLQKMKVGGKAKLACPSSIAYGERGAPPKIKPGAALLFEVELLGIEEPAAKPAGGPAGHP
jgi:FKBP-type peptidyl-prolyl cis-trans isomerase FkpA/FKBP-type peptidyl-prolyl cis-trans isomerase FklB